MKIKHGDAPSAGKCTAAVLSYARKSPFERAMEKYAKMFLLEEMPKYAYDWWFRCGFEYPVVLGFACFAAFAYGACLGSFMNVCIWRMPRRESVVSAPSHCTNCGEAIRWYDNLPVLSYLILRGRCRACRAPYSPRYFLVEVLTGALFVAILVKAGLSQQIPGVIFFYCTTVLYAVGAAWTDAEHRIIPNALTYPAMILALAGTLFFPEVWGTEQRGRALLYCVLSGAIPGAFLWLFSVAGHLICKKEVLGMGDVKFVAACGMLLGLPGALFSLFAGALAGTLYGAFSCLIRRRKLSSCAVAFGPFLALGAVVWIFAGNFLLRLAGMLCHG